MQIVNFPREYDRVGANGVCPHCFAHSYFKPVTSAHVEVVGVGNRQVICNGAQCEACKKFILAVAYRGVPGTPWLLESVYPLGKPNENVEEGIPPNITADFREALRCRWVNAYKATVTMCRRAIQASCLDKKANPENKLVAQIDELAAKGLITEPLRQFAHEVRLEGNEGAHPDPDGLDEVTDKDADEIIEFTREYLHHVYVMPEKLAMRKPAAATAESAKSS